MMESEYRAVMNETHRTYRFLTSLPMKKIRDSAGPRIVISAAITNNSCKGSIDPVGISI
jgi:hypothetical protein